MGRRKRGSREGGSVVSEGSSRKLQGCLLNTPMYLSAAGKARYGDKGTPGPAQRRGLEGSKADHCSPDSPSLTSTLMLKWKVNRPPSPAFRGFEEIREVCVFGCACVGGLFAALDSVSVCVCV